MQGVQPLVGLTQLPVHWVLGHLPPTVKRPRHEADDSPHLVPKLGISEPTPPCLPCAFMACRGTNLTTRFLTAVPAVANLLWNSMLCDLADTHQRLRYWRWFCLRGGGSTFLRNVCRLLSVAWHPFTLLQLDEKRQFLCVPLRVRWFSSLKDSETNSAHWVCLCVSYGVHSKQGIFT
jgi:hypothetical protein